MIIKAIRNHKDHSPAVTVELTERQLVTLCNTASELEIVLIEQYRHLHPAQKRYIKVSVRHWRKFRVWDVLEAALEQASSLVGGSCHE